MLNDFLVKKPQDMSKININDIGELIWWSYHFATSPEKILSIVNKVGTTAELVRKEVD